MSHRKEPSCEGEKVLGDKEQAGLGEKTWMELKQRLGEERGKAWQKWAEW